jgi:hypothetical protein
MRDIQETPDSTDDHAGTPGIALFVLPHCTSRLLKNFEKSWRQATDRRNLAGYANSQQ